MNPHASLYLQVNKQHARDLGSTYQHAQRGWAHPDFPNRSDYVPVRESRIAAALRRLRRRQSQSPLNPSPVTPTATTPTAGTPISAQSGAPVDARVRSAHAA